MEQCIVFRKIFDKKLADEEIILQGEAARNVHEQPFPKHNNRGKGHAMMVSVTANGLKPADRESDIDQVAEESSTYTSSSISTTRWTLTPSRGWPSQNPSS